MPQDQGLCKTKDFAGHKGRAKVQGPAYHALEQSRIITVGDVEGLLQPYDSTSGCCVPWRGAG